MKKILIVGASSCLGSNLAMYLRGQYSVYGTYYSSPLHIEGVPSFRLPITPEAPIKELFDFIQPDVTVYCAAITDQTQCQSDPEKSDFVNAQGASLFANAASMANKRFVYLSSSKVFSGKKGNYTEGDKPDPVEFYGFAKKNGEELSLRFKSTFVLRLGTIVALGGLNQRSLFGSLLRKFWLGKPFEVVSDEYRSFVPIEDFLKTVGNLVDAEQTPKKIFHLGGSEKLTHLEFAERVCQVFGFDRKLLRPTKGNEFHPQGVTRQPNLHLTSEHMVSQFFLVPTPIETALSRLKEQLRLGQQ